MATIKRTGSQVETTTSEKVGLANNSKPVIPPDYPVLEKFEKPMPQFESDLQRHYRFGYFFGLDDVRFDSKFLNSTCGKVTKEIEIRSVDKIELESLYSINDQSSIEFSIIDDDTEIPILPINDTMVRNEKIFFGLPLRFTVDESKPYFIKKDGIDVDVDIDTALNESDGLYTITYTPIDAHSYKPSSESVKLKVILRMYDEKREAPYINSALIRAYGGDALWTDRL